MAVLRALQLGDLLCAVPALRALRAALPDATITLIGLPWAEAFVTRFRHYLDAFLEFPGYPGLPERQACPRRVAAFLADAQARQFDLTIQMHGSGGITNPLAVLLGARHTAGFYLPGNYCPDPDRFLPYPADEYEIRRHLRLLEFLGAAPQGEHLEFPLTVADHTEYAAVVTSHRLRPGRYVCLHAGAREPLRRWPPAHFAAVGDALADRGLQVVLTGSADEAELTRQVAVAMRSPCTDLAGLTSLGSLAALVQGARLLVCNDTGVSHVAAAVRTPSVILVLLPAKSAGWTPLDGRRHRAVYREAGVTPADVLAEADELLALDPRPRDGKEDDPCVLCAS